MPTSCSRRRLPAGKLPSHRPKSLGDYLALRHLGRFSNCPRITMSSSARESFALSPINEFLVSNHLRISDNPCVSPDFCLDWNAFVQSVEQGGVIEEFPESAFVTEHGNWVLVENEVGDHAWCLTPEDPSAHALVLANGVELAGVTFFPASFENLIGTQDLPDKLTKKVLIQGVLQSIPLRRNMFRFGLRTLCWRITEQVPSCPFLPTINGISSLRGNMTCLFVS